MNYVARKVRGRDFAELPWTELPGIDFPDEPGEEPWWVVVAEMAEDEFASTTVDAPSADEAEADGQRVITGREGRAPARIARVTGPFPKHVPTEERERRPGGCHGCGLERFCGNHPPTLAQTWFVEGRSTDDDVAWECINCGTLTWIPKTKLVTDGGVQTVIRTQNKRGDDDVYHTDPFCRYLGHATTDREVPLNSLSDELDRCSACPPLVSTDGGLDEPDLVHPALEDLDDQETVRVTVDDDVVIGQVDDVRNFEDGEVAGHAVTVMEGGYRGRILDLETQYDPRTGWSELMACERLYTDDPPTEFVELGPAEIEPIDPGVDPDKLDAGRVVELLDGAEYRVVVPPWERKYDSKALVFNLESSSNLVEKADPSEVVRLVR